MDDNTRRVSIGLFAFVVVVCLGAVAAMSYGGYIRTNAVGEIVDVTVLNKQVYTTSDNTYIVGGVTVRSAGTTSYRLYVRDDKSTFPINVDEGFYEQIEIGDTLKAKVGYYKGRVTTAYLLVDSILDLAGDK